MFKTGELTERYRNDSDWRGCCKIWVNRCIGGIGQALSQLNQFIDERKQGTQVSGGLPQ